ncbi:MAG: hypothetical protein AB7F50_00755 [Fimbriimonadaceae bacterium]
MKAWSLASLALLVLGCTPGQSTVRDAPETDEQAPSISQATGIATAEEVRPIVSVKPSAPKPVPAAQVAGKYEMVLSSAQEEEIDKGLKSVRDLAAKGDEEAKKMLPQLEAAVKASSETAIELKADGTYVARVSGSEAKGKFKVLGTEVRFDAPTDGSPAAYPVMTYDFAGRRLLAKTGGTTVEFVRRG